MVSFPARLPEVSTFNAATLKMKLRASVILAVVSGLLVPVSISTTLIVQQQEQILAAQFSADHRRLAELLALGMQAPLWDLSVDEGRPLFNSVLSDDRVVSVLVSDDQAGPFLFREYPQRRRGRDSMLEHDIVHEGKRIGKLFIEMDSSRMDKATANYRYIFMLTVIGQLLLSLILIMLLLQIRVLSPIRRLMQQSEFLAHCKNSAPFVWKRRDEIGNLGRTLEATRQALQELFRELEEKNDALKHDIERRAAIESELTRHRNHLEELVAQRTAVLALRSEELVRSNAELEQLAYVASHDLQEPLRMISSYLQLLEKRYKDKLDQDATTFIGFAVDGAVRMQALINDLLTYSRIGTKAKPFQPVDCSAILATVISTLGIGITESQAQITFDTLPTVMADSAQLTQLLQNLLGNAIKFRHNATPPQIHVSAMPEDGWWVFSVKDNGIGIEPEYFDRIFVMFQRLHGRRDYPGTGIGLAICKKIVERHGGHIWVEAEPGKGAVFKFTLPIMSPALPMPQPEKACHE